MDSWTSSRRLSNFCTPGDIFSLCAWRRLLDVILWLTLGSLSTSGFFEPKGRKPGKDYSISLPTICHFLFRIESLVTSWRPRKGKEKVARRLTILWSLVSCNLLETLERNSDIELETQPMVRESLFVVLFSLSFYSFGDQKITTKRTNEKI